MESKDRLSFTATRLFVGIKRRFAIGNLRHSDVAAFIALPWIDTTVTVCRFTKPQSQPDSPRNIRRNSHFALGKPQERGEKL